MAEKQTTTVRRVFVLLELATTVNLGNLKNRARWENALDGCMDDRVGATQVLQVHANVAQAQR